MNSAHNLVSTNLAELISFVRFLEVRCRLAVHFFLRMKVVLFRKLHITSIYSLFMNSVWYMRFKSS